MNPRLHRSALLVSGAVLFTSCATLFPESCEQFEERRKQTNYATEYRLESSVNRTADVKALGKGELAAARAYKLRLDTERPRPCSHLKIQKEFILVRRDNLGLTFEETREFFAENGTRIAVKNEVLTDQLRQSGRYIASVPLPIPKNSPPGKYRLTSTLTLKMKGSTKAITLAKAAATFQVSPLQQ